MPRNPEMSKKTRASIAADSVFSLKSKSQPVTHKEKVRLNHTYNEAILRLARSIDLINNLETYLAPKQDKDIQLSLKKLFIDENVDADIFHTLKMIKRHFYFEINESFQTINEVINFICRVRSGLLKTLKGLEGQLDFSFIISYELNDPFIQQNVKKDKAYVLVADSGQAGITWRLFYYEDMQMKQQISVAEVFPGMNVWQSVHDAEIAKDRLLKFLMTYHANHMSSKTNNVYISDISVKRQKDVNNRSIGYVYRTLGTMIHYGAIHIDYRLLHSDPHLAVLTLIHEASHRYAWVSDRGYYHGVKVVKGNNQLRPYPDDIGRNPLAALDNADSIAYFVYDATGGGAPFCMRESLPEWCKESRYQDKPKPLPEKDSSKKSNWITFSLWGLGVTAAIVTVGCSSVLLRQKQSKLTTS